MADSFVHREHERMGEIIIGRLVHFLEKQTF